MATYQPICPVLRVRPDGPNAAASRKACDLSLNVSRSVTSEPCQGGVSDLRITLDVAPGGQGSDPVPIEEKLCPPPGTYGPYTGAGEMNTGVAGNELVLTFTPPLENAHTYRLNLGPEVTSLPAQSVEVRALVGDVNSDARVNALDRSTVVGVWTGPGAFSCATDIDGNGRTNALDRSIVVGAWTGAENCAP